ncbi:hypothetical protein M3Y97_00206900 [Aphelenchoides bicaudatus]|nr:hypothetical protein M3Y97_00206900 [Aphelenchoides bicaudatus]
MALAKNRLKNVKKTGVKLSKARALKFKRTTSKLPNIDMENLQDCVEVMDVSKTSNTSRIKKPLKKLTKKQYLRQERKDELRKCFEKKRQQSKATAHDAMEGAPPAEELSVVEQKTNEQRIHKEDLPIMPVSKQNQIKIREKELAQSGVVTGRRMSKKKARKLMNAIKRDERENERKRSAMDMA